MNKVVLTASVLALSSLFGVVGCAAPQGDDAVETSVDNAEAPATYRILPLPDFAVSTYAGDNSCAVYDANGSIQSWRYRFVLSNKGTANGTVPMIKIRIANDAAGQAYTTYLFNVAIAAGASQVMTIKVPQMYPTVYTAEVSADPAATIAESNESNNVLVESVGFTSGLPGDGKCKD